MFPKKCFNGNFKISREVLLASKWVIETDRSKVVNRPGIYAIFSSEDGDCLYVGQSQSMRNRLRSSGTWEKAVAECDRPVLYVFEVPESELKYLECLAIGILRPKWNFTGYVRSAKYLSGQIEPDFISEADFLQIFERENCQRNRTMLALGYYGGLSASELCRLKWQDIDFERSVIRVNGRGDVARTVEIGNFLLKQLSIFSLSEHNNGRRNNESYVLLSPRSKPLDRTVAHKIVKLACQRAEISQSVSLKTLRNSHGMNLFNQGMSIQYIQKRLGVRLFKALACESWKAGKFWN